MMKSHSHRSRFPAFPRESWERKRENPCGVLISGSLFPHSQKGGNAYNILKSFSFTSSHEFPLRGGNSREWIPPVVAERRSKA